MNIINIYSFLNISQDDKPEGVEDHGEEDELAEEGHHQGGGRDDLGQQEEEHGEGEEDVDGETHLNKKPFYSIYITSVFIDCTDSRGLQHTHRSDIDKYPQYYQHKV